MAENSLLECSVSTGKEVVSQLKEELDEHREAINENTSEIEANHELLNALDAKIEQLRERLDRICLALEKTGQAGLVQDRRWDIEPLTKREKEIFAAIYALSNEVGNSVSYKLIARRCLTSESQVSNFVTTLIAKCIPLKKKYFNGNCFVSIDDDFRQAQARENLVGLEIPLRNWM